MSESGGRTRTLLWYGSRRGLRIDQFAGPWLSLGVHCHAWPPKDAHLSLHLGWWLVTIGRHYGGPRRVPESESTANPLREPLMVMNNGERITIAEWSRRLDLALHTVRKDDA